MRLNPYLSFNGDCEAAFRLYEKTLGGKIQFMMTYGESPMGPQTPPELKAKIMHVTLAVGDCTLQGADAPPGQYSKPQGMCVALDIAEPSDAKRIFDALAEGGLVQMPLQKTFWAKAFGVVTDRFGTPWIINSGEGA